MGMEGVVESAQAKSETHGYSLAVVEVGVRWLAGFEDVGFIEVGEEDAKDLGLLLRR